jgi:EAL domain-containing protein (putative c-di-GMP-specific phosphodiesterase class I)
MALPDTRDDLAALRRSIDDRSLHLLYQPEVDLSTGTIVAMEALLRWQHPQRGLLCPGQFLELAASGGELSRIGDWVLWEGLAEAVRWGRLPGPTRRLWINVTARELAAPSFVERLEGLLHDSGLSSGAIGLEFAESCAADLGPAADPVLAGLRQAGVALAVDNFSSWYVTLGVIQALPVDVVKLCQRYVRGMGTLEGERIVATVVTQAHANGLTVVAEGVETLAEAERLTALGCDRAHGWLYGSAQRADKARWLLERGTGWQSAGIPVPAAVVPSEAVGGTSPARLDLTGRLPGPRAASDRLVDR